MHSALIVTGLMALLSSLSIVDGQFKRVDDMTDEEIRNWVKPPNKQFVQRMILDRMLKVMDRRYNPCDDFYKFSCGNYESIAIAEHPEPHPVTELNTQTNRLLRNILTDPSRVYRASTLERKVRDFFDSCVNGGCHTQSADDLVESFGSWPALDPYWRKSDFDWMKTYADIAHYEVENFFKFENGFGDNGRNQIENVILLFNISVIEKDPVEPVEDFVKAYRDIIFANSRVSPHYIEGMAQRVQSFKSQLHKITQGVLRTFQLDYAKYIGDPIYDVQRQVPSCDLGRLVALITGQEVDTSKSVAVPSVQYMENICRLLDNTDEQTIADYLFVRLFGSIKAEMIQGADPNGRTAVCFLNTLNYAGPMLGKLFIDEYLTAEVIGGFANLTDTIQDFAVEMVRTKTSWLDERTRQRAMKKMAGGIKILLGSPPVVSEEQLLKLYADVSFDRNNCARTLKQLKRRNFLNMYGNHGKSRHHIYMNPVNFGLQYDGSGRGYLTAPAITYQLPLFHPYAPSFFNFGALGAAISHEYMHGFDTINILIDEDGYQQPWMSPHLNSTYASRCECFVREFGKYKVPNTDIHVDGSLTLRENVADHDGLKIVFNLYKKWMAENPDIVRQEQIDYARLQLTHEQLFWLSYGQTWCDVRSREAIIHQIAIDTHAPNVFRVFGGVSHSYDFASVYKCPPGFKMNPYEKCAYLFD